MARRWAVPVSNAVRGQHQVGIPKSFHWSVWLETETFPKFFGISEKLGKSLIFGKGRSLQNKRRNMIGQNLLSAKLKMDQSGFFSTSRCKDTHTLTC